MCNDQKFYYCKHCGNVFGLLNNAGVPIICCGEVMEELVPNTVDASLEKHVPVVSIKENIITVEIGAVEHPMTEEHHIQWIYLETKNGGQRKCLKINDKPTVSFSLVDDEAVAVYAFCNLHGLWKKEI